MGNIEIHNVEQGSEAWHQLRCGRITASKFKDLMAGLDTATYKGLINNVVGEILSETTDETYSNAIMERGIELEPEAALFYSEIKEIEIKEIGFVTNHDIHSEYIGVSPDRVLPEVNGILEIKCPLMKTHVDYLTKGKLPNEYKWQVQGQLLITGAKYCDFMSYYPGIKPFILTVYPDDKMQTQLKERIELSVSEIKKTVKYIESL